MRNTLLILHFVGMAISVGLGVSKLILNFLLHQAPEVHQNAFRVKFIRLNYIISAGLLLLVATGMMLMKPHWQFLEIKSFLGVKLLLVLVFSILVAYKHQASQKLTRVFSKADEMRLQKVDIIQTVLGILIIVLAVLAFG